MAHTKQVKAANVLNNAFTGATSGGDGKALLATDHPLTNGGTFANRQLSQRLKRNIFRRCFN